MDTPLFILGLVLICIGIYQIGKRIDWFRKVLKYADGSGGWSTLGGYISMLAGITAILESFQIQVLAELDSKSKISPMNVPRFIMGISMIGVGIFFIMQYRDGVKKGLKDTFGSQIRLLITGIGFIPLGILFIVKSF